ncbi:hypothetical protein Cgig2_026027 [Carnegiea gigantea]|uniref:Pre-mRNA polyadenylation factor Fip1 domain-containing protein n=1 Tax=Carnegiea gigantea TaxID=171969 RepID=A0A9Q1KL96_9CARY|nr:hypothetical protein Cgig2_026027 [Carnegiea gigantea]
MTKFALCLPHCHLSLKHQPGADNSFQVSRIFCNAHSTLGGWGSRWGSTKTLNPYIPLLLHSLSPTHSSFILCLENDSRVDLGNFGHLQSPNSSIMGDDDDDFGELYADVEVQASSAISGGPEISQLYIQQQQQEHQPLSNILSNDSSDVSHSAKDDKREKDSDERNDGENEVVIESGSDSEDEDDFDVVVNDDDIGAKNGRECRNVVEDDENEFVAMSMEGNSMLKKQDRVDGVGMEQNRSGPSGYGGERGHGGKNSCISQYKFVRQYGPVPMGNPRVISSSGGNKEDTDYIQNRRTTLGRGGPSYAGTIPCLSEHAGSGFWLPWNRTIVDVDIEIFEQKPWTLPGADVTDYFNFGFDEKSWKSYCQSLDQLRQQTFTRGQNQVKGMRLKLDNAATAVEELANKDVSEAFFHNGGRMAISQESELPMRQFKQRIGQAIHVEDSNIERQPSMDVRPPRARDADVVIEINVEDPEGSGSGKEPDKIFDPKCTISENECGTENVKPETENISTYKSRDMANDSVEENIQSPSASTECRRPYDSGSESSHIPQDSDSQGKPRKKSDALHPGKVGTLSIGYFRSVETLNNSMEDNGRNSAETNPCVAGIDVLFDDQIQSSPTLSDSDTQSKASNDNDRCDPIRAQDSRRSSADSIWEGHRVEEHDHISRDSERDDIKMKDRNIKHHSRGRSPTEENWKYHHQNVWKHSELSRQKDEYDGYHIGIRWPHNRSHFSAHCHRSKARLHASTFCEDLQHYREKESVLGCYDKRMVEHKTACRREFHRWDRWSSRDDMDSCCPRGWDEDMFFSESRFQQTKGEIAESEQYSRDRECMIIEGEPTVENLPHFASKYTVHREQQYLPRDYDDVRCTRRSRHDLSLEFGHSDGPGLNRYASPYPLNYRDAEYLDWDIESERHLWHIGREMETSGRRDRYLENHALDSGYPWCTRDGDEDQHWQASRSNWDYLDRHHACTERRPGSPVCGDDVDDHRLFEKHRRHGGYISRRNDHDGRRVYSHSEAYDRQETVRYIDEDDYFVRKHNDIQSRGMSWTEDRQFNGHFDYDFYDENGLDSFKDAPRHKWNGTKNGFVHGGMSMHTQVMKHKQGTVRNGGNNSCDTSSKMPTRFEHKKIGIRCRNSVELRYVDGERKPSNTMEVHYRPTKAYDLGFSQSAERPAMDIGQCSTDGESVGMGCALYWQGHEFFSSIVLWSEFSLLPTLVSIVHFAVTTVYLCALLHVDVLMSDLRHGLDISWSKDTMQPRGQSSKTRRNSGNDVCIIAHERVQKQQEEKHEVYDSGAKNMKKIKGGQVEVLRRDKSHVKNQEDTSDLEEGQIPTEEPCKEIQKEDYSSLKRMSSNQKTSRNDLNVYDENRILETLARMEKRRERFKEPLLTRKEAVSDPKPQVDPVVQASESKQQRPLRKRRWGGS